MLCVLKNEANTYMNITQYINNTYMNITQLKDTYPYVKGSLFR